MLNSEKTSLPLFAAVALPFSTVSTGELTYHVPESLTPRITLGACVIVPVGSRKTTGIVTALLPSVDTLKGKNIKDILDIVEEDIVFSEDMMRLWRWSASYYLTSLGEMLSTILPSGLRSESDRIVKLTKTKREKKSRGVTTETMPTPGEENPALSELSATEQEVVAFLHTKVRVTTKMLKRHFSSLNVSKVLQRLEANGIVEVREHLPQRRRSPQVEIVQHAVVDEDADTETALVLSDAQTRALEEIHAAVRAARFQTFLLYGVTGSGKTEVYLQAAQQVVETGKSVLLLVPEIALTSQLVERVEQRFGAQVAVLHSGLVASARWAEWRRIARGEARVVVGVRSAVFAPMQQLGLVIVDEEHDAAYKQQDGVRYNARDLAVMRGQLVSCPVILGSATPSLESYVNGQTARYTILTLPERVESRLLPTIDIVDLKKERLHEGGDAIFSPLLRQAIVENYQAGKQSLLFVNRRGYANYLQCRVCGDVVSCKQCSVTLTFHLKGRMLRCHYCGFAQPAFDQCPTCQESSLTGTGFGTEQVEEALRRFLPEARTARLDRDSVSRRGSLGRIIKAWRAHEFDVLIGTQMVAKGHDVPGVTLVGVLRADSSLHFPDFRAAERTFQVLTQVAGRAGRGSESGRVILQTYLPQHYSVRLAARQDFLHFATHELRYRKQLGYPPFVRIVCIRCEGRDGEKVRDSVEKVTEHLVANMQGIQGDLPLILGPAPAPLERLNGRERWHVLIKGGDRRTLHAIVRKTAEELRQQIRAAGVRLVVDVDPYDML
ncbi:MAG: primosomal protein N' [Deltaproteobacteria bacterium]|nr:primosomal protein N' [Deltaproteobacteria bacterium]